MPVSQSLKKLILKAFLKIHETTKMYPTKQEAMKKWNKFGIVIALSLTLSCDKSNDGNETQNLSCLPPNLQNGVLAYYAFGNGSLNDTSGNNYHLLNTTSASPGEDRAGNPNCAFQFNFANNEYVHHPNPTFLDNLPANNFSISFWYKSLDHISGYGVFISRDDYIACNNSTRGEWSVSFSNGFLISHQPNGGITEEGIVNTNWNHVVITSNNTNNQIYVNGNLVASGIGFYNCPIFNQGDLFLGKFYNGSIDDVIIYNRVVTPTEVTELFNLNACCN